MIDYIIFAVQGYFGGVAVAFIAYCLHWIVSSFLTITKI